MTEEQLQAGLTISRAINKLEGTIREVAESNDMFVLFKEAMTPEDYQTFKENFIAILATKLEEAKKALASI